MEFLDKVVDIDQSPIGRTPRSNPATYTGCFTPIRDWFAGLPEAKARGYRPGRFSFNVKGGRCEACQGDGVIKIEMHFLPDVFVTCDVCHGRRFNRETLEVNYRGKSIADVLDMTVESARRVLPRHPADPPQARDACRRSGSATSSSASRRPRSRAARRSGSSSPRSCRRRATGETLYILDEPTTGLHFEDVRKLLEVLHALVEQGNTVVVIEHNLEVIKTADRRSTSAPRAATAAAGSSPRARPRRSPRPPAATPATTSPACWCRRSPTPSGAPDRRRLAMARDEPASAAPKLPDNVLRKLVTAEQAVADIRPGEHVFVGTACATPRTLVAALEQRRPAPADVTCYHFLTNGAIPTDGDTVSTNYHHYSFFVGTDNRLAVAQGKADYIPISIAQVPALLQNRRIAIDTALIQVSRPDRYGYVSLGVSVDIVRAAVGNAARVVAEINPNMPRTMGETFLHVDGIDRFVWVDVPVIEYAHEPADEVGRQIARYIAGIIGDGATLQVGLGRIPSEAMRHLENRRDLGIHSDVITDAIVPLVEQGVITGKAQVHPSGPDRRQLLHRQQRASTG